MLALTQTFSPKEWEREGSAMEIMPFFCRVRRLVTGLLLLSL